MDLEPVILAEKEGLALINGTDGMLGMLALALHDGAHLLDLADLSAALSVQALRGTDQTFRAALQDLRPHRGQATSAAHLFALLENSPIVSSHTDDPTQVQDAYSLRCAPQVHGAARDTFAYAQSVAEVELSAAIDNPSILPDGQLASNGNFHGAPVAYVLDFLAIAVADLASIAERRTDRLMDPARNYGLPAFLAHQPGVDSGFMIAQYTQAALVTEMKRWATPARKDLSRSVAAGFLGHARRPRLARLARGAKATSLARGLAAGPRHRTTLGVTRDGLTRPPGGLCRDGSGGVGRVGGSGWCRSGSLSQSRPHGCRGVLRLAGVARTHFVHLHLLRSNMHGARPVSSPRGTHLTAQGWPQEAALRMLQNNLDPEVAERPDDLVVYGGTGRAARDWRSFDALVRTLTTLKGDETMLVQSGRPVGVFQTHEWAPRVLIANSNLVGDWATWPEFRRLESLGLTMYGQMTAGSWIYIGTQGILQGTYETFAAVAKLAGVS